MTSRAEQIGVGTVAVTGYNPVRSEHCGKENRLARYEAEKGRMAEIQSRCIMLFNFAN